MAKSHMLPAVLQAFVLFAFSTIVWHNVSTRAFTELENTEAWKNVTATTDMITALETNKTIFANAFPNMNGTRYDINETHYINVTARIHNGTNNGNDNNEEESFYWKTLPRELVFMAVILPLEYLFQIWLERTFPGRARPTTTVVSEKDAGEGSDAREDELIKRLIAQGKIRRSSLSWTNTFIKWILDMTLGQIWRDHLLWTLLEGAWHQQGFKNIWSELKWGFIYKPWIGLFSFRPLASLLSFIIVPAHQRIVFLEGATLLWVAFLGIFLSTVVPWFMRTELVTMWVDGYNQGVQKAMADQAQSAAATLPTLPAIDPPNIKLVDEL